MLQTLLVGIVGAEKVALSMQSSAFSAPALGPVWFDLGGLVGVGKSVVPVLFGGIGSRSVAVQDVVFGLEGNGLGKLVSGTGERISVCQWRSKERNI